jgi:hypothetical protein
MSKIITVSAAVLSFIIVSHLIRVVLSANTEAADHTAFSTSCESSALAASKNVSITQANVYCNCLYVRGSAQYGKAQFLDMLVKIGKTNDSTPLDSLISECIKAAV